MKSPSVPDSAHPPRPLAPTSTLTPLAEENRRLKADLAISRRLCRKLFKALADHQISLARLQAENDRLSSDLEVNRRLNRVLLRMARRQAANIDPDAELEDNGQRGLATLNSGPPLRQRGVFVFAPQNSVCGPEGREIPNTLHRSIDGCKLPARPPGRPNR